MVTRASADSPWKCGDAVFGLAMGSLGSHVLAADGAVARMPSHIGFESAASCPTVFVTVDFALGTAAGVLQQGLEGNTVLIHAAAGGVGLAASQLAMAHGLEPVVTAGSPSKRAFVRSRGVMRAASSRSTSFVETIAISTMGNGTSLPVAALNSLTSPGMLPATLSCIALGGSLVEISKRDILSPARVCRRRVQCLSRHAEQPTSLMPAGLARPSRCPVPFTSCGFHARVCAIVAHAQRRSWFGDGPPDTPPAHLPLPAERCCCFPADEPSQPCWKGGC